MGTAPDLRQDTPTVHTVAWFPPERPTEGNTAFIRPDQENRTADAIVRPAAHRT